MGYVAENVFFAMEQPAMLKYCHCKENMSCRIFAWSMKSRKTCMNLMDQIMAEEKLCYFD